MASSGLHSESLFLLTPVFDNAQNVILDIPHDGVGPPSGIEIKARRKPVVAAQVQNDLIQVQMTH